MSVLGLAAFGILNYPEYVRQLLRIINSCLNGEESTRRDARAEHAAATSTASNHVVNLLPSINFDLVSRHIADYIAISNCKSVHTYQTNMCSHLAPGYKNYPLENYFTVPLLITHETGLSCLVIPS